MFIDIHRIGATGLSLQDSVELDESQLIEEDSFFLERVEYYVYLTREREKIRARGQIKTTLSLRCVYCLENFDQEVDSKFDIILFPVGLIEVTNSALDSDEMEYIFFDGEEIDLEKILMEQINLFIPYNPTCSPYCKGICPTCGVNLNREECRCENVISEMTLLFDKIKR